MLLVSWNGIYFSIDHLGRGSCRLGGKGSGFMREVNRNISQYAKERIQFGKPIADNQAIQWMLADMATETEAARALTMMAAQKID